MTTATVTQPPISELVVCGRIMKQGKRKPRLETVAANKKRVVSKPLLVVDVRTAEKIAWKELVNLCVPEGPRGSPISITEVTNGSFGVVHKVLDSDGNLFACKIQNPEIDDEFPDLKSVLREVAVLSTFRGHPNIVRFFCCHLDFTKGIYSLAMEWMDGDLSQYRARRSYQTRSQQFNCVARQILSGLSFLHSQQFAHRDIKAHNILFRERGGNLEVKLADFGFTRRLAGRGYSGGLVTMCYRPPELLFDPRDGNEYGTEVDMWSVGIVFSEIILGYVLTYPDKHKKLHLIQCLAEVFDVSAYSLLLPTSSTTRHIITHTRAVGIRCYLSNRCNVNATLLDLMEKLLTVNPELRLRNAQEALHHPYFAQNTSSDSSSVPHYLEPNSLDWTRRQSHLTEEMRDTLIEWLYKVCDDQNFHPETYSQCVEFLDAFMSKTPRQIETLQFQKIGCAALYLAAELNEIYFLSPKYLAFLTEGSYTGEAILAAALEMFQCLEYRVPRSRLTITEIRKTSTKEIYLRYKNFPTVHL